MKRAKKLLVQTRHTSRGMYGNPRQIFPSCQRKDRNDCNGRSLPSINNRRTSPKLPLKYLPNSQNRQSGRRRKRKKDISSQNAGTVVVMEWDVNRAGTSDQQNARVRRRWRQDGRWAEAGTSGDTLYTPPSARSCRVGTGLVTRRYHMTGIAQTPWPSVYGADGDETGKWPNPWPQSRRSTHTLPPARS